MEDYKLQKTSETKEEDKTTTAIFDEDKDKTRTVVLGVTKDSVEDVNDDVKFLEYKPKPRDNPFRGPALDELFRVVDCISIGSPCSVYVVRSIEDGKLYALKKIECNDESDAIKAFYEEMELKKLDDPYVCDYKEFFITYEKEASSVFVNIIMQYFPEGNLRKFIRGYQNRQEVIPEQVVKKILGEILEGLVYINDSGFIHRNIKPSNIFQKKGGAFVVGDLGVSTIMGDLKTHTRQTFRGTVFMAPEIGHQPHDEKSDLYSLGGVLLNMVTSSIFTDQEFCKTLHRIKETPEELNGVLDLFSDKYSKSMVNTIQTLLRHKHSNRPTILELIKSGYIQECMAQVDSTQLDKRSRHKERESVKICGLSEHQDDIVKVLKHIAENANNELFLADALSDLADILRDSDKAHEYVDQKARDLIAHAIWDYVYNKEVVIAGCYVLSNLIVFAKPDDILYNSELTLIHKIMAGHEYDPEVQLAAADLILALSANEKSARTVVQLGGIQDILTAMRHARYHATLNAVCCLALWSLTVDGENLKVANKEHAVKDVCLALNTHKVSPEVCEAAAAALVPLLLDDGCYDTFTELDCTDNLVAAIHLHKKNAKVVKNCCKVLATVVEAKEECAFAFLSSEKEDCGSHTGIPTVMEAYKVHKDNADVVEAIVRLLLELSHYDDICSEMQAALVGPQILSEVNKRYKENRDIMGPVKEALDRLKTTVTHETS